LIHQTNGIILHTTKYSENSLIVKVYTLHFGLQSYIINGIRSKNSKNKASLFQPLAIVELQVTASNKGKLERISEINSLHPYKTIPYNIIKSSIAIFINEILYRAVKEEHSDEELFEFICNSLLLLDLEEGNCSNFHLYFMVELSRYLGFYPQGKYSATTSIFNLQEGFFVNQTPSTPHYLLPSISCLLYDFMGSGVDNFSQVVITNDQRKKLLSGLITFYRLHVTSLGEIKSHLVLEEVVA